jgi:hypothetical protein
MEPMLISQCTKMPDGSKCVSIIIASELLDKRLEELISVEFSAKALEKAENVK